MRFKEYNSRELEKCGQEFVKALLRVGKKLEEYAGSEAITTDPLKVRTEYVLDWFAATVAAGHVVDARRRLPELGAWREILKGNAPPSRNSRGEFLLDLVHTTFPDYYRTPYDTSYYRFAVKNPCRVRLALESEWGSATSPALNFHRVLGEEAVNGIVGVDEVTIGRGEDEGFVAAGTNQHHVPRVEPRVRRELHTVFHRTSTTQRQHRHASTPRRLPTHRLHRHQQIVGEKLERSAQGIERRLHGGEDGDRFVVHDLPHSMSEPIPNLDQPGHVMEETMPAVGRRMHF